MGTRKKCLVNFTANSKHAIGKHSEDEWMIRLEAANGKAARKKEVGAPRTAHMPGKQTDRMRAKKKVHPERQTFERGDSTQDSNDKVP